MQPFTTRIKTNLNGILQMTEMLDGIMMTGDDCANKIIVELHRDRVPVAIEQGTKIVGYFVRSDNCTLETAGEVSERGEAIVTIPAPAYSVPGILSIAIRMFLNPYQVTKRGYYDSETGKFFPVSDPDIHEGPHGEIIANYTIIEYGSKTVIAALSCFVQISETETIVDPAHTIPDLQELLSHLDDIDRENSKIQNAELNRQYAEAQRERNEQARQIAIQNMTVSAVAVSSESGPTATITDVDGHKSIQFGLVPGKSFSIVKSFPSIAVMQSYTGTDVKAYDFVIIASDTDDPDNAKLYLKEQSGGWRFIADLSGATGPAGNGIDHVSLNSDYTLTLYYTDGSSYTTDSVRGPKGDAGPAGPQGTSINSVSVNQDYTMTVALGNGTTYTTPFSMRGPKGEPGTSGFDSIYDASTKHLTIIIGS